MLAATLAVTLAMPGPVPILTYHDVRDAPAGFAAQVAALARAGYTGVTLRHLWAAWHGGPPLPAHPVVITFDDGYAGQYSVAGRVLARRRWPAVLNLESARVDAPGGLRARHVRTLLARGWELASHTLTHPDLRRVGAARLRREVAGSRALLRRRFKVPVDFFCYPYGRSDASVVAAVRAAGYRGATTVARGLASPASDPYALPRLTVRASAPAAGLMLRIRTSPRL